MHQHQSGQDGSSHFKEQVKTKGSEAKARAGEAARKLTHRARDTAFDRADRRRTSAAQHVSAVARVVRASKNQLEEEHVPFASYADTLGDKIDDVSHYLERQDAHQIVADIESLARRQPLLFVAGAFGVGILAGRLFRVGQSSYELSSHEGGYIPPEPVATRSPTPALPGIPTTGGLP